LSPVSERGAPAEKGCRRPVGTPRHAGLHYMTTVPANRRRQWAGPERVASLQGQIDAITAKGQVAWVDVKDNGDFVLYQAAHGAVPVNLPRTPR
jgi:hypothetical protein